MKFRKAKIRRRGQVTTYMYCMLRYWYFPGRFDLLFYFANTSYTLFHSTVVLKVKAYEFSKCSRCMSKLTRFHYQYRNIATMNFIEHGHNLLKLIFHFESLQCFTKIFLMVSLFNVIC